MAKQRRDRAEQGPECAHVRAYVAICLMKRKRTDVRVVLTFPWLIRGPLPKKESKKFLSTLPSPENEADVFSEPGTEENGKEKEAIVAKEIENTKKGNAATNIDNTAKWIRRVNEMAPTRHKHGPSARPNNLSELPINKEPSDEIRRSKSMVFTPWKAKEDQDVPAVKGCSPVISRVNVHGFLPSFDGAGDMPSSEGPNHGSFTFPGLRSSEGPQAMNRNPGQQSRPWYVKEPREKPNPAEIRRFFRQIAEEERGMIHKYRIQDHGEA